MSDLQTITGVGRLIHEQTERQIRYRLYVDPSGRATMIELLDRPDGLASDRTVRVVLQDGRYLSCQVLDDTPMCAVIGDGILQRERDSAPT
jgi:hypothetical protein